MLLSPGAWLLAISTKLQAFTWAARAALASKAEEMSLIEELWQYFLNKYFSVRFEEHNYQNINLGSNSLLSAQVIILSMFLGIIIAAAIAMFQKRTLGDLVRALDREDANTPERAMTLEQLGLLRNAAIKEGLRRGTSLKRVIRCVEEEAYLAEQEQKREELAASDPKAAQKWKDIPYRYDFFQDHFYIPEDKMFGATSLFAKKGTDPLRFVITVIACIVFASVVCWLLPDMVQLADNFIGFFKE